MALHVALLESPPAATLRAIAERCAAADAPLHAVGPVPHAGAVAPPDWGDVDWWLHPGWRDFRDAMARERCLYFAADAERDAGEAPFRRNSVLVLGSADGMLPDRILAKYPTRIYRLPMRPRARRVDLAASVGLLLDLAMERLAAPPAAAVIATPTTALRYGRGRQRR
jgi:tRNA(Leu) C34 or U34 (ribose-2'-O)-methylase TrmL